VEEAEEVEKVVEEAIRVLKCARTAHNTGFKNLTL
jgi:hypothetical protein